MSSTPEVPIADIADTDGVHDGERGEDDGLVAALEQLCSVACSRLDLLGVTVTLMPSVVSHIAAASSPTARRFEEAQFAVGEGPTRDAFRHRRVVLADLEGAGALRWPAYAPAALNDGVRAIAAFPLHVGAAMFGVLTAYSRATIDGDQPTAALAYADRAVGLIVDRSFRDGTEQLADDLELSLDTTIDTHAYVFQAQGMVMVDLGVSLAEALMRMRAHAWAAGQDLSTLAAEIVAGRTRLPRDVHRPPGHSDDNLQ